MDYGNDFMEKYDNYGDYDMEPSMKADHFHNESPSSSSQPRGSVQTFTQVTVHQLLTATAAASDESFRLDRKELQQVSFIGLIIKAEISDSVYSYDVDDGTGTINVKFWPEKGSGNPRSWREGFYVRVVGHLRSFTDSRSVIAFKLLEVPDLNELTYHFLEVLSIHLQNTRSGPPAAEQSSFTPYASESSSANPSYPTNDITQLVLALVSGVTDVHGASRSYIIAHARSAGYSEQQTHQTIETLANAGAIYTSIDDNHFKAPC